jgi:succinoglycan biosynthesis protein ExoO
VIVPVFNGEAWIERSVRSALEQSCRSLEVLVVDDGSTDGTAKLLSELAAEDARVMLLRTPGRRGPGGARNLALDAARGRWVAFLDSDDRFHPDRLERLLAAARAHGVCLIADNQRVQGEDGEPRGLLWPWVKQPVRVDAVDWVTRNAWDGRDAWGYGYAKPVVLRELIENPRLRMRDELSLMEDYHFMLALLRRGHELLLLPEPGYDYTVRRAATTHSSPEAGLRAVLRAGEEVLREVEPGSLRQALLRQQYWVELRAVRFEVLERLKAGDGLGAMRLLWRHPAAWRYVAISVGERLQRRVDRLIKPMRR